MRNFIIEANRAGNAALLNDFIAIKSFVKRNGTNRRLLGRKVGWDWTGAYRIVAELKEKSEFENVISPQSGLGENLNLNECLVLSG